MASDELKINGLILRDVAIKDYDKIVNILTAEKGRISASGKGIKSLKNKNMPATQLFCYSSFILKKRGNYYYISESDLIENFFGLRGDLGTLSLASYICDVASDITMEENDETETLRLTLNTLYAVAKNKRDLSMVKAAFELKAAQIAGFMPGLSICGKCGTDVDGAFSGVVYLDVMNGRLLCGKCVDEIRGDYTRSHGSPGEKRNLFDDMNAPDIDEYGTRMIYIPMSRAILDAMRYVLYSKIEKFLSFTIDTSELKSFSVICEKYLLNHLEHGFQSLDFYKTMMYK